jgi:hypothetical protein
LPNVSCMSIGKMSAHCPDRGLSAVENRTPVFSFSLAPFEEIFRTEERHVSRFEFLVSRTIRRVIDRHVRCL